MDDHFSFFYSFSGVAVVVVEIARWLTKGELKGIDLRPPPKKKNLNS